MLGRQNSIHLYNAVFPFGQIVYVSSLAIIYRLSSSLPALDSEESVVDVDKLEDAPLGFRHARRAVGTAATKEPSAKSTQRCLTYKWIDCVFPNGGV